jgi:O-antigen ligase/polysaccharide polymerase Wzy-like membrane protein
VTHHARGARPSSADIAALLPALAALVIFLIWDANGGGYAPTSWYPGGLALVGVLVASLIGYGVGVRLPKVLCTAAVLLAGFTAWSFLSVSWSGVSALAWDGSNRTALYLVVFLLFGVIPWRVSPAAFWLGLFSVGVAVVGVVVFVQAARSAHPGGFFIAGRFTGPVEYPNGSAGLFLMAGWPALLLSSRREAPWPVRGLLLASAGVLLELLLLTQSRGALLGAAAVSLLFLAIVPSRVRAVLAAFLVGLAVFPAGDAMLDVYRVVIAHGDTHSALVRAGHALVWTGGALLVVGFVFGYLDRRFSIAEARARLLRRLTGAALIAGSVAVLVLVATQADPERRIRNGWHHFTATPKPYGVGLGNPNSHFASDSLSGNRYDVWRVAWHQFERHPTVGAGADNFAVDYLRERRSEEEPRYPFSIELRALGQTGLVGAALLGGFLLVCAVGIFSRRLQAWDRTVVCAAALLAGQWLAHGSVEILWEIPGLAAPAFAAFAIALRLVHGRLGVRPARAVRSRLLQRASVAGAVAILALLGTSFVFPWLAAAEVRTAEATWRRDPAAAFEKLRQARSLNLLSDQADVTAGLIASRQQRWGAMRGAFRRALRRDPLNWYSWFELAVVNGYTHRRSLALAQLRAAKRLNPREWTIGFVRYRLNAGRPLAPRQLDQIFRIRILGRTAPAPPRGK